MTHTRSSLPARDTPLTGAVQVATLVAAAAVALSLGAPVRAAEQSTRAGQIEQQKAQKAAAEESRKVVRRLKDQGLTGRDIAAVLGVSPQRVSQLTSA